MGVPAVGLFTEADAPQWRPQGRALARVIDLDEAGRIDPDALLAAVEAVAGDRRRAASTAVAVSPRPSAPEAASPAPPAPATGAPATPASDAAAQ
jgi:hypothetical protein